MKQLAILLFIFSISGLVSAAPTNTSNVTTVNCTTQEYCVKLNGKCSADWWGPNKTQCTFANLNNASSNPICCPSSQYCVNGTCMENNIGSSCSSQSDCYGTINTGTFGTGANIGALMMCYGGYCQAAYGTGDTCQTNTSCFQTANGSFALTCLNTSKCSGSDFNESCVYLPNTGVTTCNAGLYCKPNGKIIAGFEQMGWCDYVINGTGNCNGTVPCSAGYQCDGAKCVAAGSVASGSACGNASLACSGSAQCTNTQVCETLDTYKLTSCTSDTDCTSKQNGSICVCNPASAKGYCVFTNASNQNNEEAVNLVKCLQTNNCGYNYQFGSSWASVDAINPTIVNPNKYSCAVESCNSDLKKYISAGNTCNNAKASGNCYANSYCSGFPVWAIIVIVVVAVILVLSVVIVVFLVLRKRRDYSSI